MTRNIAVIDCAIKRPSLICFNRLVHHFNSPQSSLESSLKFPLRIAFTYHAPPHQGLSSLEEDSKALAYIIFGSASNVEDRLSWQNQLATYCDQKLMEGRPVLGLCFGHQLMADFYGLEVNKNSCETSLKGTRKVKIVQDRFGFNKGQELILFKAHSYQVYGKSTLLEKLGTSEECEWDAFIHRSLPFIGFQTHPEASRDFYQNEIEETIGPLPESEIQSALKDGLSVIENFVGSVMALEKKN